MKRKDNAEALSTQRFAEKPAVSGRRLGVVVQRTNRTDRAKRAPALTTADLVLLSLLAERPMHGYQANRELERRQVRDWAGVSRPQVYYSLEKLLRLGLIRPARSEGASGGPERQVFATSARGRAALARALEREDWTRQRE